MIKLSNEIKKRVNNDEYYTEDELVSDCKRYIKAVASGRMLYRVTHVSSSGMSRNIDIMSYEGTMLKGSYCTYYSMLKALDYKFASKYSSDIKVSGCGMDMLFATNYNIIHQLHRMGFINKANCDILAQKI